MRICITAHLHVFYDVPEDDDTIADLTIADLTANIENGIQHLFEEGLLTGDVEDAECLTFEASFSSEFAPLLPAAEHILDIREDLKSLGHSLLSEDPDKLLRLAYDQGLVDDDGMYDPSEAARQYASTIQEQGL
jgi:hypothetical protein